MKTEIHVTYAAKKLYLVVSGEENREGHAKGIEYVSVTKKEALELARELIHYVARASR